MHTWLLAVVARVLHYHLSPHALDFHSAYTYASAVNSTAVASFLIISQHDDSQSSGNFLLVSSWRIGCMLLAKDLFTAYGSRRSATTRKLYRSRRRPSHDLRILSTWWHQLNHNSGPASPSRFLYPKILVKISRIFPSHT